MTVRGALPRSLHARRLRRTMRFGRCSASRQGYSSVSSLAMTAKAAERSPPCRGVPTASHHTPTSAPATDYWEAALPRRARIRPTHRMLDSTPSRDHEPSRITDLTRAAFVLTELERKIITRPDREQLNRRSLSLNISHTIERLGPAGVVGLAPTPPCSISSDGPKSRDDFSAGYF